MGALVVVSILVNASFVRQALQVRLPGRDRASSLAEFLGARRLLDTPMAPVHTSVGCPGCDGRMRSLSRAWRSARFLAWRTRSTTQQSGRDWRGASPAPSKCRTYSEARTDRTHRAGYSTALLPFFAYLDRCTSRSDRLIVTSEFPDVLVLAGRRFAGEGVVFGAWYTSWAHQGRTLRRLRAQPALFALHMGDYATFRERFDLVDRYLNVEYEPMADIPVEGAGVVRILVLRARPTAGVDSETGWRCFISTS